jgi:hypothetical protein
MSYSLFWRDPSLPFIQKQNPISVPAGSTVSTAASIRFTGKGAANYGKVQQENLMRLLENFASATSPDIPTVGQLWYDTSVQTLKVCIATAPSAITWRTLKSTQVGTDAPFPAALGDSWFKTTGSASGISYHYTGVGRFPQTLWSSTGYLPAANIGTLAARINVAAFADVTGSAPGEAYIHGFSTGVAADVDGTILFNGSPKTIEKGLLNTTFPTPANAPYAFVIYDDAESISTGRKFFVAFKDAAGSWFADVSGSTARWTEITPSRVFNAEHIAIGTILVSDIDYSAANGISSITIWEEGKLLSDLEVVDSVIDTGAIGGWEQYFPSIDTAAGRFEYDLALSKLMSLIGDPFINGGSGAYDIYLKGHLPPLNTLDASLKRAFNALDLTDIAVADGNIANLKVDVTSQDWDKLLAVAKWAVSRYEFPATFATSISNASFVSDGLPMDPSTKTIYGLSPDRETKTRFGTTTLSRFYQETINILETAIGKRYTLRGMLGSSGINTTFNTEVSITNQVTFTADVAGAALTAGPFTGLRYQFDTNQLHRFFTSGQAIEIVYTHTPSVTPTTSDVELKSITDNSGRLRLTADKLYIMASSAGAGLTSPPVDGGFGSIIGTSDASVQQTFATFSVGASTISFRAQRGFANPHSIDVYLYITTGSTTTGNFSVQWNWVNDSTEYVAPNRLYPAPVAYTSSHKLGTTLFTVVP